MKNIKSDIVPLALSILILLVGLGICLTSNFVFGYRQYIAIPCLTLATVLYFKNKKIYFLFFALVLTLGLFGLLDFYYRTYRVGFGEFGINPLYVALLILFFVFSKNQLDYLFPEKSGLKKRTLDENLIKSHESKFANKDIEELNEIIAPCSKFTDEAKEAAMRVLKSKNVL